jgi:hypothetical protein
MAALSVALLCRSYTLPRWQADTLRQLTAEHAIRVTHIVGVDELPSRAQQMRRGVQELMTRALRRSNSEAMPADAIEYFPAASAQLSRPADLERFGPALPHFVDLAIDAGLGAPLCTRFARPLPTLLCAFGDSPDLGNWPGTTRTGFREPLQLAVHLLTAGDRTVLEESRIDWKHGRASEARAHAYWCAGNLLIKSIRQLMGQKSGLRAAASAPRPGEAYDRRIAALSHGELKPA